MIAMDLSFPIFTWPCGKQMKALFSQYAGFTVWLLSNRKFSRSRILIAKSTFLSFALILAFDPHHDFSKMLPNPLRFKTEHVRVETSMWTEFGACQASYKI